MWAIIRSTSLKQFQYVPKHVFRTNNGKILLDDKKPYLELCIEHLGPVVQSVVSLTSSLRVVSLTVLADSIYNILTFFAEKMWVVLHSKSYSHFFSKNLQHIWGSLDANFNKLLTNNVVSFEQLGPDILSLFSSIRQNKRWFSCEYIICRAEDRPFIYHALFSPKKKKKKGNILGRFLLQFLMAL